MIIAAAALILQSGTALWSYNQGLYKAYRECVLSQVHRYLETGEDADTIKDAAFGKCRSLRTEALFASTEHHLKILEDTPDKVVQNPNLYDDTDHFDRLDKTLSEDASEIILEYKVQHSASH